MTARRESYTLTEEGDKLTFTTVLFRSGGGSALNSMVYNRELATILVAGGAASLIYLGLVHGRVRGLWGWLIPVVIFVPAFLFIRFWLLKDRVLRIAMDRSRGLIEIERERLSGTFRRTLDMSEVLLLEAEEIEAPDESDLRDIIRWHQMAEPGVHATPLPLYKLKLVLRGGEEILIFTDCVMDSVIKLRRRLGEFLNIVQDAGKGRE